MLKQRSFRSPDARRVDKAARLRKAGAARDGGKRSRPQRWQSQSQSQSLPGREALPVSGREPPEPSPIVTLAVGRDGRLFAAHDDVLRQSPLLDAALGRRAGAGAGAEGAGRRIALPDEEPEVLSAVLEFLYKGDYYPRLVRDRARGSWELEHRLAGRAPEQPAGGGPSAMVPAAGAGGPVLRDTAVYCAAQRYGLPGLQGLALRKQGLAAGIDVGTIVRSAAYAYAHTPDSDGALRAHYLALVIRCRRTFARSGTMQAAMEAGGSKLFFDLFVALCNHLDVLDAAGGRTLRTV